MGTGNAYPPLNANDAVPQFTPGGTWEHPDGNTYKYMQYEAGSSALTLADGMVCYSVDTTGYNVTPDVSDAHNTQVACVAQSVITDEYWGWFQVGGVHPAVYTDGGVADGDILVGHTVDGQADTFADGEEEQMFAVALATDTTASQPTVPARLKLAW